MRFWLVVTLLTIIYTKQTIQNSTGRLKVSIYYESLCPDSVRFITRQLYPAYGKIGSSLLVDFVPYGKATVINWETTLNIPKQANLSKESMDLILKLCTSADKRLGKNASEVKAHPFFYGIDFEKGLRRQSAPHIPKIDYPTDTSNFDPVDPDKLRNSNSIDSSASDDFLDNSKPFHGFFEFTFRRFFDDGGGPAFNRINLDDSNENQGPVYV